MSIRVLDCNRFKGGFDLTSTATVIFRGQETCEQMIQEAASQLLNATVLNSMII